MAFSMRTLQQSLNQSGFSRNEMMAMFDTQLFVLQNFLSGATAGNGTTTLADALVSGRTDTIIGTCLQVDLDENINLTENNIWCVEAHIPVTTVAAAGLKMQLTAYDGLVFDASTDFAPFTNWAFNYTTTAALAAFPVPSAVTVAPGATATFAANANANVVTVDMFGMVRIKGHGRIGIQFAQATASGSTSLAGGYFAAFTVLP